MVSNPGNRWAVAASTFVVWGLAAAGAVYWGLKLGSGRDAAPVAPAVRSAPPPDAVAIARMLGAVPSAEAPVLSLASRFQLIGVVANRDGGGAALIAIDGKPPKPYRVGAQVDDRLLLLSVESKRASIGPSRNAPPAVTLELPRRQ